MMPPMVLNTSVNSAFASSKSPTRISHVSVHPDWALSFKVSHSWVKVFTFVAASSAVCAIWAISFAWASVKPCCTRSASVYAPANCFRVSVRTSVVSHSPLVRDSRKEPYILMAFWAPVPSSSDVRTRASWNTLPPMPALTTEFQSIRDTLPAASAWES